MKNKEYFYKISSTSKFESGIVDAENGKQAIDKVKILMGTSGCNYLDTFIKL